MGILSMIAQVADDMENNLYNFTKNGTCSQCGNCCSNFLPLSADEVVTINNYVVNNNIKECIHALPVAGRVIDATCPFLDMEKPKEKCRIYPVRPLICRKFICNKEQRPSWTMEELMEERKVVDVRKMFFEKKTIKKRKK